MGGGVVTQCSVRQYLIESKLVMSITGRHQSQDVLIGVAQSIHCSAFDNLLNFLLIKEIRLIALKIGKQCFLILIIVMVA